MKRNIVSSPRAEEGAVVRELSFFHDDMCPGRQKETWPDPVHANRQSKTVLKGQER